jgi:hypothetical protein
MRLELTSIVLGLLSEVNYPLTNRLPKPLLILFRLLLRICYDIIFETSYNSKYILFQKTNCGFFYQDERERYVLCIVHISNHLSSLISLNIYLLVISC